MRAAVLPIETKKATEKNSMQSLNKQENSEVQTNPMMKTQVKIRQTYQEYTEAQKDFKNAFKDQERENQEAFKESERKYKAYQDALNIAFGDRETAEKKAIENYQKLVENARGVYVEDMKSALAECKKSTESARNLLVGIPVKEAEVISQSPIWFNIQVKKPDLKAVKKVFFKSRQWLEDKKSLIGRRLQGSSKNVKAEVVAE